MYMVDTYSFITLMINGEKANRVNQNKVLKEMDTALPLRPLVFLALYGLAHLVFTGLNCL